MKARQAPTDLLFFWAERCAPCATAKPIVAQLAEANKYAVRWLDCRSEEADALITAYGIVAVPTMIVLKHGKKIASISGPELQEKVKLGKRLERLLAPDEA